MVIALQSRTRITDLQIESIYVCFIFTITILVSLLTCRFVSWYFTRKVKHIRITTILYLIKVKVKYLQIILLLAFWIVLKIYKSKCKQEHRLLPPPPFTNIYPSSPKMSMSNLSEILMWKTLVLSLYIKSTIIDLNETVEGSTCLISKTLI